MTAATFTIAYDDLRFRFPEPIDRDHVHQKIRNDGTFYEVGLLRFLAGQVKGPGVAIDCGANIGNHALFFAGVMKLRTIAVEPVLRNYTILQQVLDLNGLGDNVELVKMALDDHEGEVRMTLDSPGNFGMYRVGSADGDGTMVRSTTLDALCRDLAEPVRLVKIDVEGFQDQVVRGATEVLARDKPLIAAELASTAEYDSFLGLLRPLGYVPVDVFNRTPTIIFAGDGSLPDNSGTVTAKLRAYERRMIIAGPIQSLLSRLKGAS